MPFGWGGLGCHISRLERREQATASPMPFGWGGLGCVRRNSEVIEAYIEVSNAFRLGWFGLPWADGTILRRIYSVSNAFRLGWFGLLQRLPQRLPRSTGWSPMPFGWGGLGCGMGNDGKKFPLPSLQCLSAGVVWAAHYWIPKLVVKFYVSNAFRLGWFGLRARPKGQGANRALVSNAFRLGWFGLPRLLLSTNTNQH